MRKSPARRILSSGLGRSVILVALLGACNPDTVRQPPSSRAGKLLLTNQDWIEAARSACPLEQPVEFFRYVLDLLPDAVTVYPSENYYYFETTCSGKLVRGNIRLDVRDRDSGIVHFAYYTSGGSRDHYKAFSRQDGVNLTKLRDLEYRLSFRDKNILFRIHPLPQEPCSPLEAGEESVGNLMDESGLGFMLLYSRPRKTFKFILCHDLPGSVPVDLTRLYGKVWLDERTGFAFFREERLNRERLIGVKAREARDNTYFDGPFDQIPVNYLQGNKFRLFIEEAYPGYAGQVNNFGDFIETNDRVVISPYELYVNAEELTGAQACDAAGDDEFFSCFGSELKRIRSARMR